MSAHAFVSRALTTVLYAVPITPLFFMRSFSYPLIVPRVFVFQALVAVAVALWGVLVCVYGEHRPRWTAVSVALVVFLGAITSSSIFGVDVSRSLWSVHERGLGLIALFHFAGLFFVLGSVDPQFVRWRRYLGVSIVVSVIVAVFAWIQVVAPAWFFDPANGRPGSLLGNPTFLATYLLFHVFLLLWFVFDRFVARSFFSATLFVFGVALELSVIFMTQTRGALIGFVVGILVLLACFAIFGSPHIRFVRRVAGGLLASAVLLAACLWVTRGADFWEQVPGVRRFTTLSLASPDIQPRLIVLRIAWEAFRERPVLGYGFENFKYPFDQHYDPQILRYGFHETHFDKPHNVLVEYLVVGGVAGFVTYLLFLGAVVFALFRVPALRDFLPFGAGMYSAYIVQNLFIFDTFGSYLLFFVTAAFLVAHIPGRAVRNVPQGNGRVPREYSQKQIVLIGILGMFACVAVFGNGVILYALNHEYWGVTYFLNRMPNLAVDEYRKTIATPHPYVDRVRFGFASVLAQAWSQGVRIDAIAELSREAMTGLHTAIQNTPNDYFLRTSYGDFATVFAPLDNTYIATGKQEALRALELSPKRQHTHATLAKLAVLEGDPLSAREWARKSVELDPNIGEPHLHYGILLMQSGELEAGSAEIQKAAQMGRGPANFDEAVFLGNTYGDAERYAEATDYYITALSFRPEDLETRLKLGIVYYYAGKHDLARREIVAVMERADLGTSPAAEALRFIVNDLGL